MVVKICPHCDQRYIVDEADGGFVHECNSGNDALDNEDVKVVGDWEDYTGSGVETNINMQGVGNKLWGTRGAIEGEDFDGVTKRGANAKTHRQRQHQEFI